jgi:hypothetical protein
MNVANVNHIFGHAYKAHSLFWALRLKLIDASGFRRAAAEEKPWTLDDIVKRGWSTAATNDLCVAPSLSGQSSVLVSAGTCPGNCGHAVDLPGRDCADFWTEDRTIG